MEEEAINEMPEVANDEIGQVTANQLKENLQHDIESIETRLGQIEKEKANYNKQVEIDQKIWDIIQKPGALRKIVPEFEFEKDPVYWEAQEEKNNYKIRENQALIDGQLSYYDKQTEELLLRLESAKEKLLALEDD